MQALKEDSRNNRRTVADALEVIRQEFGVDETPGAEIRVGPLLLPSGEATAVVVLICRTWTATSPCRRLGGLRSSLREVRGATDSRSYASTKPR
jgi:hypothetical protein